MVHYQQEGYLLSASAPGLIDSSKDTPLKARDNALLPGHTYSILKVKEVYSHKLINIRNIWGSFEWDGAWSRKSAFWTPDIIEVLNPKLDEDDGTFWMSFEDFLKHFTGVNVCKTQSCHEVRLKGKFVRVQ